VSAMVHRRSGVGTMARRIGLMVGIVLLAQSVEAQFAQQGSSLVGGGTVGPTPSQGNAVAISADGNTIVVGGPGDALNTGAAWVFTRRDGAWSQQGLKLVGSGAAGGAEQGWSVAISADGGTAIVGGPADSGFTGAAWVFARSAGGWSQQGAKLAPSDAVDAAEFGAAVALSADGDTAIVGGEGDDSQIGAAWVFTRSGGRWSQQGSKLTGFDAVGSSWQGWSVGLSADGNTAVVGGYQDDLGVGAAWVFARNGAAWLQVGAKLVGTGVAGSTVEQGRAVAISADGSTVVSGGDGDDGGAGAAWIFSRGGGGWPQQGGKLVGSGAAGDAAQGRAVAVSADGATAVVGGPADAGGAGAAWVFTRTGEAWSPHGGKLVGGGGPAAQGTAVAISADGATVVVGGPRQYWTGAAWVFVSPACAPSITTQPHGRRAASGEAVTLAVAASGSAPLSYQWYEGEPGDTSTPVGSGSGSLTTPPLTASTSFWVRVGNGCGHADSEPAAITVGDAPRPRLRRAG